MGWEHRMSGESCATRVAFPPCPNPPNPRIHQSACIITRAWYMSSETQHSPPALQTREPHEKTHARRIAREWPAVHTLVKQISPRDSKDDLSNPNDVRNRINRSAPAHRKRCAHALRNQQKKHPAQMHQWPMEPRPSTAK